ncbi:MAG: hypothetical protein ACLP8X_14020 [Streptosporangiaceae bacterium]
MSQWSGPRSGCCEQDHAAQPFSDIRCKQCRIVIFLSGLPRANETCWSAAIIVASYLLAIFLLRGSGLEDALPRLPIGQSAVRVAPSPLPE